ncbi:transporter substrate-binding protein, partial [Pleurocapsales cyanobacterium LEGE 10410]|nr:transporter substrate-binding protein [Pleurocapsales cyanobacterium LEGE 10410]
MSQLGRRKFLLYGSTGILASLLLKGCGAGGGDTAADADGAASEDGIKVGILHSLSGTMAISETTVVDAEMMAINEINAAGGVLGRQIIPIKED